MRRPAAGTCGGALEPSGMLVRRTSRPATDSAEQSPVPHPAEDPGFLSAAARASRALPAPERPLIAVLPARRSIAQRSISTLTWCSAVGILAWLARPWIAPWHMWLLWGCAAVVLIRVGWEALVRQSRIFACSPERAIVRFGVLSRNAIDLPWDRVQQVILRRSLVERLFGLGTLGFATASGGVDLAWVGVARPWALHARVRAMVPGGAMRPDPAPGAAHVETAPPSSNGPGTLPARPLVVGLAGGIGAGKSAAAREFARLGWLVSDSDAEARHELQSPEVREVLRSWWGESILDGAGGIDRAAVARIVFSDPAQRTRLEGLIHPRLRAAREQLKAEARSRGAPGVVIDAPLLFEAGLDRECDAVVFVDAPRPERLDRVSRTRGWSEDELARREAAQMPLEEKKRRADTVIVNAGDEPALRRQVEEASRVLLARGPRRIDRSA